MYIQQFAQEAASRMNNTGGNYEVEVFIDPVTISLIITIVTSAIKLINACIDDDDSPVTPEVAYNEIARKPSRRERIALRMAVRREITKEKGFRYYIKHGGQIHDAILETAANKSAQDIEVMFTEV